MCERFEQYRTSSLACGAVNIAHNSQPQPEGAVRTTPDMLRITSGQNEARIHAYEKKIITGDTYISHHSPQQKIDAPHGPRTDAVAIGSTCRPNCGSIP